MDLCRREVAGLPNGGGGTIESPLEPHSPHSERGWGFTVCLGPPCLSLGRWGRWLSAKGGERVLSCGRVRVGAA